MPLFDPNDPHPDEIPAFRYPDQSNYGREMRKWDRKKRDGGMNADGFEKFPMMLHCARQSEGGKWVTAKPEPDFDETYRNEAAWDRACKAVMRFNETCQRYVYDQAEYERVRGNGEGWRDTPTEALAYREHLEREVATEAAARAQRDKRMSPAARAEAAEADAETIDHVPVIPEKRRGRPRKVA
jgi:hypothetical protein